MKITWQFDKCILCLKAPPNTFEHIIPESIGGRLQSYILCKKCNDITGSKLISKVKQDPSIRIALRNLSNKVPDLEESVENGQIYIGRDINNNLLTFIRKKSEFKVQEKKKRDDSLILDTKKVEKKHLKKILKKRGFKDSEILEKIDSFKKLENNIKVKLTEKEKIVKWGVQEFELCLSGPIIDNRAIILISYNYLSLLIGKLIYGQRLEFLRNYILDGVESEKISIQRFRTRKYSPFHQICPEFFTSKVILTIILFGYMVFKVNLNISLPKVQDYVYLEDLENKKTLFSGSIDNAKKGKYFNIK